MILLAQLHRIQVKIKLGDQIMFCQVEDNEVIQTYPRPTSIVIDGVTHPKQVFMDKARLKSFGILPYREDVVDKRFYLRGSLSYEIGSDEVVGTYAKTAKDIAILKNNMIDRVNSRASSILARDDWMAIREAEGGTAMPDNVKAYRAAIREESNDKETEIKALSDLDAVMLYEATPYIETQKNDAGENVELECPINLTNHYFAEDPLTDDPSFVSLVKK